MKLIYLFVSIFILNLSTAMAGAKSCPGIEQGMVEIALGDKRIEVSLDCREHQKRKFFTFKIYNPGEGHFLLIIEMKRRRLKGLQVFGAFHKSENVFHAADANPSRKARRAVPGLVEDLIEVFAKENPSEAEFQKITEIIQTIVRSGVNFGVESLPF